MSRLDELTLKLADGDLSEAERVELEGLLRASPEAARDHAAMLDLVASLRAESPATGQAARTLDRIHERITEKIEVGVIRQIRARGPILRRGTVRAVARRSRVPWLFALAAAAAVMVAVAVAVFSRGQEPREDEGVAKRPPKVVVPPPPLPKEEAPVPRKEEKAPPPVEPLKIEKPPVPPPPVVPEKKPELPAPVPEPKPEPPPAPKPAPPTETVVVVATLERAENTALLIKGEKKPAKAGQEILEGQGVEAEGAAIVKFADGTRLDLRPRTALRELSLKTGKSVVFSRGMLSAQVAEQAADRPMTFVTPQAEVRVLGTVLRISVDSEADGATGVEVAEGKVRVKRLADGKSVDLARGTVVMVAKAGGPLAAQAQTGLLAHWKLDETAGPWVLDSSGNLFHGKLQGDATWVAGRTGGGVRFGATGHISLQGFKAPDSFTVSFWVYQAKLSTDQDWFVNFGGNEFMFMREGNMDRRQIRTGFENPQEFLTVASVIQAGQWTHFAVTCDGAEIRVYANGMPSGSRKITRREFKPDATFGRVGAGSEAIMDDIRLYDRAVPATDIPRIMAGVHPVPVGRR